ncbi:putative NRPS-like enzyme [Xylogone sp. PMI_703]|nr:putative NRPS-like enzyme [Xylogone sp. PMI_703]
MSSNSYHTIDELLRTQGGRDSGQSVLFYPSSGVNYVGYSALQLDTYALRVAQLYMPTIPARKSSGEKPAVIALLGVSDFDYVITLLALTKLGHTVMLLSPRLTKPAYRRLLSDTGAKHIVFQQAFEDKIYDFPDVVRIPIAKQVAYDGPISQDDTNLTPSFDMSTESQNTAWIFHSSGSTGLPKPVRITHRGALANYQRNISKLSLRCLLTLPLFHTHGIGSLFRAIITGKPVYFYNTSLPLTKDYLVQILEENNFELFAAVPYALKILSESNKGVELLKRLRLVTFGGSPCPDRLGDFLTESGINLVSVYGMSETGPLMMSTRPQGDKHWNYLRPTEEAKPYLTFEPTGEGRYELICLDGLPSKSASNRDDGSYATKDLFIKHPTLDAWKYCGRNDDVIVLENGEKVNPIDMEGAVAQDQLVSAAIVFGAGRPYPGMLIIPSPMASDVPKDDLIDQLWSTIAAAQATTPAYAKISKEMVIVLPHGTAYPKTDKDTVVRKVFYNEFKNEIEEFYRSDDTIKEEHPVGEEELRDLVLSEAAKILYPAQIAQDSDFFELGMDSLQASRLRRFIVGKVGGQKLGFNVVFDYPSARSLSKYLYSIHHGSRLISQPEENQISSMITKYSCFKQHIPRPRTSENQHAVLTGATGSLGAHLLATLIQSDEVKTVYCLVRASSQVEAQHRVIRSLHTRRLYSNLSLIHRTKIISLPCDLSLPSLGLQPELFEKIASEITVLYHSAWNVNFNLRLNSFERDCVAGVKNLIDLCLQAHGEAPATFTFFSSVGTVLRTQDKSVPESLPTSFSNAQSSGYGRSKLVTEHICINAADQVGIPVYILRVGQIIGDTTHGIWNSSEAIPLMIQTARTIGHLPDIDEEFRWMPVDLTAQSAIEISNSNAAAGVFNLVNPCTLHWTREIIPYLRQAGLEFELCDTASWLKLLEASDDPVKNPPVKLLEYFKRQFDTSTTRHVLDFKTEKSQRWSKTFSSLQAPDRALIQQIVRHFVSTGWRCSLQQAQKRRVVALSGSALIQLGDCQVPAVPLVASVVSTRLGILISDAKSVGFSQAIDRDASQAVNYRVDGLDGAGTNSGTGPILTVVENDMIRDIPSYKIRFLVLEAKREIEKVEVSKELYKDIDVLYFDTTSYISNMIDEIIFWAQDFLSRKG